MTSEQVIERLKIDGCRITKQRRLIIDVIMNNDFNSCKDIYYQVAEKDKTVGMATVYRMIRQLEDMGIVHRIDMDTTGIIIACKNDNAHQHIAKQLAEHSITRKYVAIVEGNIKDDEGTVDAPIARSKNDRKKMAVDKDGKRAVTHYKVLERLNNYTYIECVLETGRTHQIRVHMSYIHHPLLGDEVYGGKSGMKLQGQCLHAMVLGFIHPRTNEYMEFSAPIPEYFNEILNKFRKN